MFVLDFCLAKNASRGTFFGSNILGVFAQNGTSNGTFGSENLKQTCTKSFVNHCHSNFGVFLEIASEQTANKGTVVEEKYHSCKFVDFMCFLFWLIWKQRTIYFSPAV